jgi:hypothetical protein
MVASPHRRCFGRCSAIPALRHCPRMNPIPDGDLTEMPDWLREGRQTSWFYALTHSPPGLLKRIDRGALLAWAVAEDLHSQTETAQAKVGSLVRIKTKAMAGKDDPGVPVAFILARNLQQCSWTKAHAKPRRLPRFASSPPSEALRVVAVVATIDRSVR